MEEEMEVELPVFEAREVDLDYEFDAARFFDFTREESLAEAREAEFWFESAPSYPPSPFVAKLFLREDILLENVNTSPKPKVATSLEDDSDNGMSAEFSEINVEDRDCAEMNKGIFTNLQNGNLQKVQNQPLNLTTGLTFYDHISHDKAGAKSAKTSLPRSSTLMKPTTSHLAKQNRSTQVGNSRFQTQLVQNGERNFCNSSVVETQAAKRQKLEGGHLHKVADIKHQTNLVHKAPKREGTVDKSSLHARLKLTIPREPDLETAHRAQRIRPKIIAERENITAAHRFKARPLNRKILEAPSLPLPKKSKPRLPEFQEFRLKTLERAMQHVSAVSSSSLHCSASDKELDKASGASLVGNGYREFESLNTSKLDGSDVQHNFKARHFNKKIFSSKGDIGVFRNSKRETTVPTEFNFQTEKRIQPNLPVELFSKLSLTSELQPNNGSQLQLPRRACIPMKGSKENRLNSFQPEHEMTELMRGKTSSFDVKQNQCGNDGCIKDAGTHLSMRSLGIR
ncbi:protein TPX2-like isoform X1 [Melia azedarach]|uniref:Protein TPX2-like isoform X1 n=2 Tax=Melia azedarach TaxID=155640 RepID=A0ACC1XPQ4_MELAZ|nr:protein TPX2-like isoform X1 [Melia azedarach]KAJ4712899.1 protein TPX2-like isoform X1 [Melia azedarach]